MVVPSHPPLAADKVTLRREARERRQAFIESVSQGDRGALELKLADVLAARLVQSRVTGGYCPLPSEISPLPAMDVAAKSGAIIAYPAFADHQSNFRFLAGDP